MEIKKFEIGSRHHFCGLYGGSYTVEVIRRTKSTVTFREYWIAEDTGKECHEDVKHSIEIEAFTKAGVEVERVEVWEYHGEKGYVYAISNDELYDLITSEIVEDDLDELDEDSYEEKEYGPSNPWDAPGMSVSDFI